MPFYLQMSKNITQQRDIYDTVYIYIYVYILLKVCVQANVYKN